MRLIKGLQVASVEFLAAQEVSTAVSSLLMKKVISCLMIKSKYQLTLVAIKTRVIQAVSNVF